MNGNQIFAPPAHDHYVVVTPGAQGGDNWPPSSYNPDTHMFYVCAQSTVNASIAGSLEHEAKQGQVPPAELRLDLRPRPASPRTRARSPRSTPRPAGSSGSATGSATPATRAPRRRTATSSSSGRNNGELQAYNAKNGKLLWRFQTGAGANDTATFFERNGKEYIAFYAGGNSLAGTAHADNLWLFALDGTLGPLAAPGSGTAVEHAGEAPNNSKPANPTAAKPGSADAAAGAKVFAANCSVCHGADGHGGNGGPDLTSIPSAKQMAVVVKQVTNGGAGMPAFKGTLNDTQIDNVAAYVTKKITK